jgi:hypothetical protein
MSFYSGILYAKFFDCGVSLMFAVRSAKNLRNQSTRPCASATSLVGSKVDKGMALEFRTTTCPLRFQYLAMRHKIESSGWVGWDLKS